MMKHGVAIVEITTPSTVSHVRIIAQVSGTMRAVMTTVKVAMPTIHGTVTIVTSPSTMMSHATVTVVKAIATTVVVQEDLSTTIGADHHLTSRVRVRQDCT
jgi:hypothetical protein